MKAIAGLCGLIGLLPSALTIRDELKDNSLEIKDFHSAASYPASAFVELQDAAKKVSSKSAGKTLSQTVRTGKGRHHHHGLSEGHHHHRHKKHHHARRHHDDTDDESTEDERDRERVASAKDRSLDTFDDDSGVADEDELQEEKVPHRSRRKEPESEEEDVDEDDQEWEDGEEREDPPRRHRSRHSDEEQRAAPEAVESSPAETETTEMKTEQPATTKPSMTENPIREAVAQSPPPTGGPLDVLSVIWAWILPCFGWTIVIVLVILVALRIKWPELSNIGVRYVAKRMSLSSRKHKEKREAQDKPEQKEAQGANEEASAAPEAASASA